MTNVNNSNAKTTKKTTVKAPKTPKTKVAKQVAMEFETNNVANELKENTNTKGDVNMKATNTNTKVIKDNGKDSQIEINEVKEMEDEALLEELNDIENLELDDETSNNEDIEEIENNDNQEEDGDVSTILDKEEFVKLSLEEQKELMKYYRDTFSNEQLKIYMQLSTSQFYKLLEKLGLHQRGQQSFRQKATPKTQARATTKSKREISVEFGNGSVVLEGDLCLDDIIAKLDGFLAFGGGNEGDYEFRFELVRK